MRRALLALAVLAAVLVGIPNAGAAPRTTASPVVYVAGDSTIAQPYLPVGARYMARLQALIPAATVVDVSHSGQSCMRNNGQPSLEAAWPSIVNAVPPPTTIVVEIGMNDVGVPGVTNQSLVDCWNWLYFDATYGAIARGIRVIPCLILPVWPSRTDLETQRLWVNGWLRGYFGGNAVADFVTPTKSPTSEWVNPSMSFDANVHPNWLAAQGMAAYTPLGLIQ